MPESTSGKSSEAGKLDRVSSLMVLATVGIGSAFLLKAQRVTKLNRVDYEHAL